MKFLLTNYSPTTTEDYQPLLGSTIQKLGSWNLYVDTSEAIVRCDGSMGIVQGYLRDLKAKPEEVSQHNAVIKQIFQNWPPEENITGSFSAVIFDYTSSDLVLCNDVIGIYPLYYYSKEDKLIVSNSLIEIGKLTGAEFDEVGILQRSLGPEFSNIGSRTILKNCKRLLPGEHKRLNHLGRIIKTRYDNTLYSFEEEEVEIDSAAKNLWKDLRQELIYCTSKFEKVYLALSGGLDSRLLLGAVPENKKLTCLNYGPVDSYETKIAARLAKRKGADFSNFSQPELYFPEYSIMRKYVFDSEAVNFGAWLEIFENLKIPERSVLLMGDMTEVLNARNIKAFSSREFRRKNFFSHYILKKRFPLSVPNENSFNEWKSTIIDHHWKWYKDHTLEQFHFSIDKEKLKTALKENLEEIFERISAHNLPYIELYDELFSWYTHSRIPMGKQILISNSQLPSCSPSMSLNFLRKASKINPNMRLGSRLMNKMFSKNHGLKNLQIPTSQIPLVPSYAPNIVKFPLWGLRNAIDNYLIKNMVRSKKVTSKYRLFKSMNWALIYQHPQMEENLKSYFRNNYLGEKFSHNLVGLAVARKNLVRWPFANIDLISLASLNIELDLIKENNSASGPQEHRGKISNPTSGE